MNRIVYDPNGPNSIPPEGSKWVWCGLFALIVYTLTIVFVEVTPGNLTHDGQTLAIILFTLFIAMPGVLMLAHGIVRCTNSRGQSCTVCC